MFIESENILSSGGGGGYADPGIVVSGEGVMGGSRSV